MGTHPDILIVGGGVIGLTTAYYLASEGLQVTLLDRENLGRQSSWAGAGIIPPGNPARAATPYDLLRARSSVEFPILTARLLAQTGIDNGYRVCGGIEVPEGDSTEELPTAEWHSEGIAYSELDRQGIDAVEPGLAPAIRHACHLPHMGQVRNPRHLKALQAACAELGVRLVPGCAVKGFLSRGQQVEAVETEQGRLTAGRFLLATGAWTAEVAKDLGWQPPIRPVRGQMVLLNTRRAGSRPVLLQGKRYLVPREDGLILIGSTEEEAGFDASTTESGTAGLLDFGRALLPELARAGLERSWAGLRPGSPDDMPYLGRLLDWENVFVAAGHFRAGIQLSPGTGLVMTDLLLGRPLSVPLPAFRADRPPASPSQTAFRS